MWRIAAINEAGGWKDRTTVEDMDLAVRASLKGWKFLYLGDLQVFDKIPHRTTLFLPYFTLKIYLVTKLNFVILGEK